MIEVAVRIQDGSRLHLCAGPEDQDANPVCVTLEICQPEATQLAEFLRALGHVDTAEGILALVDQLPPTK
jgi:hypothetical protein